MSRIPPLTFLFAVACVTFAAARSLALAPAAGAATYSLKGAFDENHGEYPLGVAVNQSNGHVFVANWFSKPGIYQFESSGAPVPPEPFAIGPELGYAGVAVDPENQDVYAYDAQHQEIATFEPSGSEPAKELRHFTVTGGPFKFVQIASNAQGDIFYPNQTGGTVGPSVQEFEPSAEGATPTPIMTIEPAGEQKLVEPKGVAVDSARGKIYVVDKSVSAGRVQVFNAENGAYESTLDEAGSQAVAIDPVNGDVFTLDLNEAGSCEPLSAPCHRVRAYHSGETTPFAEFGEGTIGGTGEPPFNHLAVDHGTGDVYVSDAAKDKVWIFVPGSLPPPGVLYPTPSVTGVSASEATLHGEVNPEDHDTSCHLEYGETEAYGVTVPCQPELVGEGTEFKPESFTIAGLAGNTKYHFRLVATVPSIGVTVHGVDQTFTTQQRPAIDSASIANLTTASADLTTRINPNGFETTYHFEWGTSTSYGTTVPIPDADIGSGLTDVAVTTHLSGLSASTTYHWRILTMSSAGATGATVDHTFITLQAPSSPEPIVAVPLVLAQPSTVSLIAFPAIALRTETVSPPKPLTRVQKLAYALKQCRKDKKKNRRLACEKTAYRRYAAKPKPKRKK